MSELNGEIVQIIGPVVDVNFTTAGEENLPKIHDALSIKRDDGKGNLIVECQQHIGEHTVRAIAMESTDGLRRGMKVTLWVLLFLYLQGNRLKGEC